MNPNSTDKIKPAVLGGVAAGVLSAIPLVSCLNCFCCALVIGGGFLASWLYFKDQPRPAQPPYGEGALVGLMAGVVAAVAGTIVSLPMQMISGAIGLNNTEQLEELFAQADMPPEAQDMILGLMAGGGAGVVALLVSLFLSLALYSIFSTLGGVLGAALLHNQMKPAGPAVVGGPPGYAPPPVPPAPPMPPAPPAGTA